MAKQAIKYITPNGETVPSQFVPKYDKKRDRIARKICKLFLAEQERLIKVKAETNQLISELQKASRESVDVKDLGGKEGNVTFRSFDGSITVSYKNAKRTEFDERLDLAQQLIMEVVKELSDGDHSADLIEIATKAFQPRRGGSLDMQRIRDLRNYNVKHPKWKQAIEIISKCERTIGHRQYISVTQRKAADQKPENIILDIAAL